MNNFIFSVVAITTTLIIYTLSGLLYKKFPRPFTLPILISTILLIFGLLIFNVSYESYHYGAKWVEKLLGPAVVALAYPLYLHRRILMEHTLTILVSVSIGSVVGLLSGLLMANMLGVNDSIIASLLPKSVTTPVAMEIAKSIGGVPSLAAVMVMFAGIAGAVLGPTLFKWIGVKHYLARGLGMGSASHAIGTSRAMEESMEEGAVSTVAMVLSAVIVTIMTQIIVIFIM
jgi:predicted murein hydrolase (TIGR00659 family)